MSPRSAATSSKNYVKEYQRHHLALLRGALFDELHLVAVSNEQIVKARKLIIAFAGSRCLLAHSVITHEQPRWMDEVDKAIAVYKPDW